MALPLWSWYEYGHVINMLIMIHNLQMSWVIFMFHNHMICILSSSSSSSSPTLSLLCWFHHVIPRPARPCRQNTFRMADVHNGVALWTVPCFSKKHRKWCNVAQNNASYALFYIYQEELQSFPTKHPNNAKLSNQTPSPKRNANSMFYGWSTCPPSEIRPY